jgi:hypothetical protein
MNADFSEIEKFMKFEDMVSTCVKNDNDQINLVAAANNNNNLLDNTD